MDVAFNLSAFILYPLSLRADTLACPILILYGYIPRGNYFKLQLLLI